MTIQIKLGSLDISSYVQAFGTRLPSRLNPQEVARRHGLYIADIPLLAGNTIRLQGAVFGTSESDARTKLEELANAVHLNGMQRFYYYSDRFWVCTKQDWNYEPVEGAAGLAYRFNLELICPDPYMYDDASSSDDRDPDGSDLTFTITNGGKGDVYPRVTFTADKGAAITALSFYNLTTGKTFTYLGTVAMGNALILDPMRESVYNNGTEDLTNVQGTIHLWLPSGANSMKYVGSACSLLTEWRQRWPM
jgi:hypothetical protein